MIMALGVTARRGALRPERYGGETVRLKEYFAPRNRKPFEFLG